MVSATPSSSVQLSALARRPWFGSGRMCAWLRWPFFARMLLLPGRLVVVLCQAPLCSLQRFVPVDLRIMMAAACGVRHAFSYIAAFLCLRERPGWVPDDGAFGVAGSCFGVLQVLLSLVPWSGTGTGPVPCPRDGRVAAALRRLEALVVLRSPCCCCCLLLLLPSSVPNL